MITLPEPCLRAAGNLADARLGDILTIRPRAGGHTVEIVFATKPVRIALFVPSDTEETSC